MSTPDAAAPLPDPAADVADLWARVLAVADAVDESDRRRPTPCKAWDVGDLLAHCAAAQHDFDAGPEPPSPDEGGGPEAQSMEAWTARGVAAREGWTLEDLRADLAAARDGHVARVQAVTDWSAPARGPLGPTTEAGLLAVRCYDLWVHLWDLHDALDAPCPLDDAAPAAVAAHQYVLRLVPFLQAKRVAAPEGSVMRLVLSSPLELEDVLVVRDGRAGFDASQDVGQDRVEASPGAFTLLLSGRESPEVWRDRGQLDWDGPVGRAFVERARLF